MSRRSSDLLAAAAFLAGAAVMGWEAFSDAYRSTGVGVAQDAVFYPKIVLAIIAMLAAVLGVRALRAGERGSHSASDLAADGELPMRWCPVAAMVMAAVGYALLLRGFGYLAATVVFVALTPVLIGYRRWRLMAITTLVFPLVSWLLFARVIGIPLPTGVVWGWG